MEKKVFVVFLIAIVVILGVALNHVTSRLDAADKYIKELEKDNPEYIDTTSGSDAYSEYYNY